MLIDAGGQRPWPGSLKLLGRNTVQTRLPGHSSLRKASAVLQKFIS